MNTERFPVGTSRGTFTQVAVLALLASVAAAGEPKGSNTGEGAPPAKAPECRPVKGSHRPMAVRFTPPRDVNVQGLTVTVQYPGARVAIPGKGSDDTVRRHVTHLPDDVIWYPKDLGGTLRTTVAKKSGPIPPGRLFTIDFEDCAGATAVASGFDCTVDAASDPFGNRDRKSGG